MDKKSILFLTKDALYTGYLRQYGNTVWHTPNIDELVQKGTIFYNYHTAAPSTIMSNMSMFTGLYPHESELSDYNFSGIHYKGDTLWSYAQTNGYECHIIWDESWISVFRALERYYCYGEDTIIHSIKNLRQGVGAHHIHSGFLKNDFSKTIAVYNVIRNQVQDIFEKAKKPVFIWLHIPHVINGYTGYGTDIEAFDNILGIMREFFSDSNIFISADHGNMNGVKGKLSYGHDVYEQSALIPLITPRIQNNVSVSKLVSNIDIKTIIFDRVVPDRKIIYCDSAFYAQPNRKLAIYYLNYKYIYNKLDDAEELYDLSTDCGETCNLIEDYVYDKDRNVKSPLRELYFYPYWDEIEGIRLLFRNEREKIWKNANGFTELKNNLKYKLHKYGYDQLMHYIKIIKK